MVAHTNSANFCKLIKKKTILINQKKSFIKGMF
nr:MAG TPA_asm: hypothetical protein [Caudoviricetes sp.]